MRMALQQKRKLLKVIIHSKALAKLFNIHGGVTRVNFEMITPKRVLEIHNPQNKHILLANDLVDLLGIKRRCKSKRFKSITNHFFCCDLLDKMKKYSKENLRAFLDATGLVLFWGPNSTKNITEELHLIYANFRDRRESMASLWGLSKR